MRRALERGNLLVAEATAREVGRISLGEALEFTALIASVDPQRHHRAAVRWLRRFLDEYPAATLDDAALATTALAALGGARHDAALALLRGLARA